MLLRHLDPDLTHQALPAPDADGLLRYLGTAGFVLEMGGRTLVIDPFVTRPGLLTTALGRLHPDEAKIRGLLPHADEVLVGHAHHDHVLDAPSLCMQTGARLIGSDAVRQVGLAAGLPDRQIVATAGREVIASGDVSIRGLPSRHGRVYGRVPVPGDIERPPPWPPRVFHLRHGLVLNWHIEADGLSVVHVDSADFIDEELEGLSADVLCLCAIGYRARPGYVQDIIGLLQPRYVIACHWDWFFDSIESTPRLLPFLDLEAFLDEIRREGPEPIVLPFHGVFGFHRHTVAQREQTRDRTSAEEAAATPK